MARAVTSFSKDGYELYGKRMLETFVEHHDMPIDVYVEGPSSIESTDQVAVRDLFKVEGCQEFLSQTNFPAMSGNVWGEGKRNYRFDVNKFCRKSFAQIDAASRHGDWLYWIDADIEFSGALDFPTPSPSTFMCYLGRPEWHSCASFVGWNLQHPSSGEFWKRYWLIYLTGTVFCLPEWHDSYILDWLREQIGFEALNLAEGMDLKGPANVFDAVFKQGHHKKGNLKHA
jgi:hypothetical protein